MEQFRLEYIRKNGRRKGTKKGVLYCGVNSTDPNSVDIGFTLCNVIDRFDYIEGRPTKGFGLKIAKIRSEKWSLFTDYFVQKSWTEDEIMDDEQDLLFIVNPDSQSVVEIPPSVIAPLKRFIERCRKYYKDKDFPEWARKVERDSPYPEDLEMKSARVCVEIDVDL